MRKKRDEQTEEQRNQRSAQQAQQRIDDTAAEDKAIDAMVKRSIDSHGP
jgi:hypothetical protein